MITERKKIYDAILFSFSFLLLCWAIFLFEESGVLEWKKFGLRPRTLEGIKGILSMHFLHGDYKHIGQNSLAFIVLNSFLFYFYRQIAFKVFIWIGIAGGALLWLWGGEGNHIGASLIIYGLAAFLFISGLIRDNEKLLRVSMFILFYYGSLVWWIFPIDPKISWEGHLAGMVIGLAAAVYYRKSGPKRKLYQWEIDELIEGELNDGNSTSSSEGVEIKYHFQSKEDNEET